MMHALISITDPGTAEIIENPGSGYYLEIRKLTLRVNADQGITIRAGVTPLSGAMSITASNGLTEGDGNGEIYLTPRGENFNLFVETGGVTGSVSYIKRKA